ncbi:MAG: UDP-N-acetyl-D-glucosamine dehydrogenase [Omnitrophica bacterium RIFCSPLOWO2_12_FULL_44_17]|uniref:UDP-N-acetyl-D-glucosamine dehydrogenase n=1 Tax=Candidatus Danuiimicrobium aquiferis TaxID=1801832 RepID=A0A1G1KR78_9BACT|nr:MAG: UDP-N-acetyl-D-glucosamine dehydrogenase [Omnitrophica bacterium RIFCSPHIGHO2_02_FULL_45_28]OGW95450.1 MAG: UDP-N-acetyl-D-glucosamine dehydrogenase [Omnitrophica bacterium RIFCSPLOWO2_12_FULL_44_17]OGX03330.1 MAG: UDP-N-acetyl-D-glucosamine dehydrogenase [Omnitrophica bacterium RIFCSPLOWO2_02_FULL_44_11]
MQTSTQQQLNEKIRTKTIRAGIIGLGYVGLPLAVEFARAGVEVIGIDIDSKKVTSVQQGKSYILDVKESDVATFVKREKLHATTDFSVIANLDTVNICVPTPLRKSKDPDISYIVAATQEIAKYVHPGMLIILESTTYPGTTEEVILPMLEEKGLKVGKDFFLAFSPERVDPGNPKYHTGNIPKVVGGVTKECTELAAAFYGLVMDTVCRVKSASSAEMVKLLENTFRSVNIGLVNELCQMCAKMNLDVWEIIDAASTKPFGYMPFYPGPGIGGHCIPLDPHYLAWKARSYGFAPRFIELASEVNESMPEFVVRKAQDVLNEKGRALKGANVRILGVTYKKNISDQRESPAHSIIEILLKKGAYVSCSDPFVPEYQVEDKSFKSLPVDEQSKDVDLAILVTDHDQFDKQKLLDTFKTILDTRNAFRDNPSAKVVKI